MVLHLLSTIHAMNKTARFQSFRWKRQPLKAVLFAPIPLALPGLLVDMKAPVPLAEHAGGDVTSGVGVNMDAEGGAMRRTFHRRDVPGHSACSPARRLMSGHPYAVQGLIKFGRSWNKDFDHERASNE